MTLNGDALDPAEVFADSRIALPGLLEGRNVLRVVADCAYTNTGEGLHRFVDPVDEQAYLYTQFEVPDARRVFACFEQPDLKATFQFTVKAPERLDGHLQLADAGAQGRRLGASSRRRASRRTSPR